MHDPAVIAAAKVDLAFADYPALADAATRAAADRHVQRLEQARVTMSCAGDLADLAARAHDELPEVRGWMNLGLTGARYLNRREALEKGLREIEARLRSLARLEPSDDDALLAAATETRAAEAKLDAVRADILCAQREFADAG
jgi:hypothetical protein